MLRAAVILAASISASGCSSEPAYKRSGARVFQCYAEQPASRFTVEFQPGAVILLDNGRSTELASVPSIWPRSSDRYEGGGYVLTLDPEAQLTEPGGHIRGPCQD